MGVPGECFLLLLPVAGFPFEVTVLREVDLPLIVGIEFPAFWPCDAAWSDLTDPEIVDVRVSEKDGFSQSQVFRVALGF